MGRTLLVRLLAGGLAMAVTLVVPGASGGAAVGRQAELTGASTWFSVLQGGQAAPDATPGSGGIREVFTPRDSSLIGYHANQAYVSVEARHRSSRESFSLQVSAPTGQQLKIGTYTRAADMLLGVPDRAGFYLAITGGGSLACGPNPETTIKITELKFGPGSWIQDLRLAYRMSCAGRLWARGTLEIHNGPAPAPLKATVTPVAIIVDDAGNAAMEWQATCSRKSYIVGGPPSSAHKFLPGGSRATGTFAEPVQTTCWSNRTATVRTYLGPSTHAWPRSGNATAILHHRVLDPATLPLDLGGPGSTRATVPIRPGTVDIPENG